MLKLLFKQRCLKSLKLSLIRPFSDEKNDKKKAAALKLQNLLSKLATENATKIDAAETVNKVKISHPVKRTVDKRPIHKVKLDKISDKHTVKLVTAVKDVADHVGRTDAEVKATEAELLHVILNNKRPDASGASDLELNKVISGMQVEKEDESSSRAAQVRRSLPPERKMKPPAQRQHREKRAVSTLDIFNGKPLGIFSSDLSPAVKSEDNPRTWDILTAKDLRLRVTHPPTNIYEEMIRWTERGQLWTFPIDNEQGLEEEQQIDFSQHVFLDEHLEPWCPSKGPIRQFMDLVLIGLSKNPHITVAAKIEHIHWYREYFENKRKILEDTGSIPDEDRKKTISTS